MMELIPMKIGRSKVTEAASPLLAHTLLTGIVAVYPVKCEANLTRASPLLAQNPIT